MWDWFDDIGDAWNSVTDTLGGWYDKADSALGGWLPGGGTDPFAQQPDFDFAGGALGSGVGSLDLGGGAGWQPGGMDSLTGFAGQAPASDWAPQFDIGAIAPRDFFDVSVNTAAPAAFGSDASWMDSLADGANAAAGWMERHPNLTAGMAQVAAPLLASAMAPKPEQAKLPQFNLPSTARPDPKPGHVQGISNGSMQVESDAPKQEEPQPQPQPQSAIPPRQQQQPNQMVSAY